MHTEVCRGLEHAIGIGEKWFRAFQARNPWFVQDSKRRRIFILLDPETGNIEDLGLPVGVRVHDVGKDGKTFVVETFDAKTKK